MSKIIGVQLPKTAFNKILNYTGIRASQGAKGTVNRLNSYGNVIPVMENIDSVVIRNVKKGPSVKGLKSILTQLGVPKNLLMNAKKA